MQQVLEYRHVPHDLEIKNDVRRQTIVASAKTDIDEGSDHLGAPLMMGDDANSGTTTARETPAPVPAIGAKMVDASVRQPVGSPDTVLTDPQNPVSDTVVPSGDPPSGKGTVIVDVNSGPVVPTFVGKTMRGAVETAQQTGLEISVIGSGIARQQSPPPGSHLPPGQRVMVRFTR